MPYINLTDEEMFVCRMIGVMRRSVSSKNVKDKQIGKDCVWSIDIDGVVGEYCTAKPFNVFPDLTTSPRIGGYDLIGRTGKTIDVKSTRNKNGRLLATTKKAFNPCDIYVLSIVDDQGADVIGWATKEMLFDEKNKIDLGHGVSYALTQNLLNKL